MLGARETSEGELDFNIILDLLKAMAFPELQNLHFVLIGLEIGNQRLKKVAENVTLETFQNRAENIITEDLFVHGIAVIMAPGLSQFTQSWKSTLLKLRDWDIPVLIASYSHDQHRTYDVVHDQQILEQYFGVKIILSYTLNPCRWILSPIQPCKHCYFFFFQGSQPSTENEEAGTTNLILWDDEALLYNTLVYHFYAV
jgi:hypothetical protein